MEAVVEHGGEIFCNAAHAARSNRFDPGLFDGFKYRARLLAARRQLAMHRRVMAGEPQRDRVGMAANDCGLALVQSPRRLRQTRLAADKPGPLRGKVDFKIALGGNRFEANSDGALKGLGRSFFRCALRFDVGAHLSIVIPGRRETANPESVFTVVAI
jgi:hypothetical protein